MSDRRTLLSTLTSR